MVLPLQALNRRSVQLRWLAWVLCGIAAWTGGPVSAQSLSSAGNLSFGTFVTTGPGTVSVAPDGVRSQSGGAYLLSTGSPAVAAQFTLKGKANAVYAITLPLDNTVYLSNGRGQTMGVKGFVSNLGGMNVLGRNGNGVFSVGATLAVGSSQARGGYSGTFSVIVNYQ
jgi:hypothetical protein